MIQGLQQNRSARVHAVMHLHGFGACKITSRAALSLCTAFCGVPSPSAGSLYFLPEDLRYLSCPCLGEADV